MNIIKAMINILVFYRYTLLYRIVYICTSMLLLSTPHAIFEQRSKKSISSFS